MADSRCDLPELGHADESEVHGHAGPAVVDRQVVRAGGRVRAAHLGSAHHALTLRLAETLLLARSSRIRQPPASTASGPACPSPGCLLGRTDIAPRATLHCSRIGDGVAGVTGTAEATGVAGADVAVGRRRRAGNGGYREIRAAVLSRARGVPGAGGGGGAVAGGRFSEAPPAMMSGHCLSSWRNPARAVGRLGKTDAEQAPAAWCRGLARS